MWCIIPTSISLASVYLLYHYSDANYKCSGVGFGKILVMELYQIFSHISFIYTTTRSCIAYLQTFPNSACYDMKMLIRNPTSHCNNTLWYWNTSEVVKLFKAPKYGFTVIYWMNSMEALGSVKLSEMSKITLYQLMCVARNSFYTTAAFFWSA